VRHNDRMREVGMLQYMMIAADAHHLPAAFLQLPQ
jgi:hypothetical protein